MLRSNVGHWGKKCIFDPNLPGPGIRLCLSLPVFVDVVLLGDDGVAEYIAQCYQLWEQDCVAHHRQMS